MPRPSKRHFVGAADRAEADDARGAARELPGAVALVGDLAAARTPRRAHVVVGGHDEAVHREQQRDRDLGDRVGVAARARAARGCPAVVAAAMSTLLGSPRHEPMHARAGGRTPGPSRSRTRRSRMSAPSSLDARRELLAVVEAQRDLLDPRVVHDVGERLSVSIPRRGTARSPVPCRSCRPRRHPRTRDVTSGRQVRTLDGRASRCRSTTSRTTSTSSLITIDRPEARNSADMEHFKLLREAWERFAADDQAWVAIITGVGEAFFSGADLKKYVPEITKFQKRDRGEGPHRDRRLPPRRRHPVGAAQLAALQADHRRGQRLLHRRRHGDARRLRHPGRVPRGEVRGDGAQARAVRGRRHDGAAAAPDPVAAGDGVPAVRRPHPGRARARDGPAERDRSPRRSCSTRRASTRARIIANAPLAVQATKQSALQGPLLRRGRDHASA